MSSENNTEKTETTYNQIVKSFNWYAFPFPVLITIIYLVVGFAFNIWHPTWLMFLTIPIYYMLIATGRKNNWYAFPYPILALLIFLTAGIFFDVWHPTWLIFLTVPIYYEVIAMSKAKSFKAKANIFPYPVLCVIFYLCIGFDYGVWNPTWLIFVTIPAYYMLVNNIKY